MQPRLHAAVAAGRIPLPRLHAQSPQQCQIDQVHSGRQCAFAARCECLQHPQRERFAPGTQRLPERVGKILRIGARGFRGQQVRVDFIAQMRMGQPHPLLIRLRCFQCKIAVLIQRLEQFAFACGQPVSGRA